MNQTNLLAMYQQLMSNPTQFLSQMGIPQEIMNDPNQIIQHLLNTGKVSQAQVNQAMQMKNSPMAQNLYNRFFKR